MYLKKGGVSLSLAATRLPRHPSTRSWKTFACSGWLFIIFCAFASWFKPCEGYVYSFPNLRKVIANYFYALWFVFLPAPLPDSRLKHAGMTHTFSALFFRVQVHITRCRILDHWWTHFSSIFHTLIYDARGDFLCLLNSISIFWSSMICRTFSSKGMRAFLSWNSRFLSNICWIATLFTVLRLKVSKFFNQIELWKQRFE